MKCPRCQTEDPKYFAMLSGRWYCRRCIQFGRIFLDEKIESKEILQINKHVYYQLQYELSKRQKEIAEKLVQNFKERADSVVLAVCGSGKTEIVYDSIVYALNQGMRVCIAIPRKTLVIEIGERIRKQFYGIEPSLFYGGHTDEQDAPLVICTTHQLYRFYQTFDLLILDETDAFPYNGNSLLQDLLKSALKGHYIFMSATLTVDHYPGARLLILNRRYHQIDLPVPKWQRMLKISWPFIVHQYLKKWQKRTLVYVPRIKDLDLFDRYFSMYRFKKVSSMSPDSDKMIDQLRNDELDFIVTTTLLERGVTIEDVQVMVLEADHLVYTKEVLLQIAGRVGRSPQYPTGEVVFLSSRKSKAITECIDTINALNRMNV